MLLKEQIDACRRRRRAAAYEECHEWTHLTAASQFYIYLGDHHHPPSSSSVCKMGNERVILKVLTFTLSLVVSPNQRDVSVHLLCVPPPVVTYFDEEDGTATSRTKFNMKCLCRWQFTTWCHSLLLPRHPSNPQPRIAQKLCGSFKSDCMAAVIYYPLHILLKIQMMSFG